MNRAKAGHLLILLLFAGGSLAQEVAKPKAPAPSKSILDSRVDKLLREWSASTGEIKSLFAEFVRVTNDKVWKTEDKDRGMARYLAPNRARLDIEGDNAESYVITGKGQIWEYKPAKKQVTMFKLPPDMAQTDIQDGPMPFLFGAKPEKVKARYRLAIVEEDADVVHLHVEPRYEEDQGEFVSAELWLKKKQRYLPSKLVFLQVNQNVVTYEFERIWLDIEINPEDFAGKRIDGWEYIEHQVGEKDEQQKEARKRLPPPR